MEYMELQGHSKLRFVSDENRGDVFGKLGVKQRYDALTYVCPECGLARIYADLDD